MELQGVAEMGVRVLAATGLLIDVGRHEASDYGDFWSRLFVIEAV